MPLSRRIWIDTDAACGGLAENRSGRLPGDSWPTTRDVEIAGISTHLGNADADTVRAMFAARRRDPR